MFDFIKKTILIGAGLASMTTEKIEQAVAEIVKRGELTEKQGKELIQDLLERSSRARKELSERMEKMVQDTLEKLNIPTRKEIDELKARVENLERAGKKE